MIKHIVFALLLIPSVAMAESLDLGDLYACRPGAVFKSDKPIDITNRSTLMASYSGIDFPSASEWVSCSALAAKNKARSEKLQDLNAKGLEHICRTSGLCYSSWNDLVIAYHDWTSIAAAARQPTAAKTKAINHYAPWLAAQTTLNNYTGLGSISFFNVSTMVSWP